MPRSSSRCFIGIDTASDTFVASLFRGPHQSGLGPQSFSNDLDGFDAFLAWLAQDEGTTEHALVCVEATGVYAEALCYFLHEHRFAVSVEGAHKVKRAFKTTSKNDPTDSRQIAEYAYRYEDELRLGQPREATLEQIRTLLAAREQFLSQRSANRNARLVLKKKVVQTPKANEAFEMMIEALKQQIQTIEEEIRRLIRQSPTLSDMLTLLLSIPSVGLLLSAHVMVVSDGFRREVTARQLAAYIGTCPYQHKSGKTVSKPARSRDYGPPMLRKLVSLAAINLRQNSQHHRQYYLRKVAEDKSPRLVLNNLLRVICAVIRDRQPYEAS